MHSDLLVESLNILGSENVIKTTSALLVASSTAWLLPERCAHNKALKPHSNLIKVDAMTVSNIGEIAAKQHEFLQETYKNRKFIGIPIRATGDQTISPSKIWIEAPFNCSFTTYEPRLLSSVACDGLKCKLSHTVTTKDTYTASEGYDWGVKVSSKVSLFDFFEAGGEVSTGGTYSCTYNKGRETSDQVECSDDTSGKGHLLLYNVKSDMTCDFGKITLEPDRRNGKVGYVSHTESEFTSDEVSALISSHLANTAVSINMFMIDMDLIPDRLLNKLKNLVPLYDPYTDFLSVMPGLFQVYYFKRTNYAEEYRRVIPFTNENGDSVYQYACTKQPL